MYEKYSSNVCLNIYIHLFILHGYIINSQYDQLPVGLIAELVEHCTGIAEVMGSIPVQASIFFQAFFSPLLLSCVTNEDLSSIFCRQRFTQMITKSVLSLSLLKMLVIIMFHPPRCIQLLYWRNILLCCSENICPLP